MPKRLRQLFGAGATLDGGAVDSEAINHDTSWFVVPMLVLCLSIFAYLYVYSSLQESRVELKLHGDVVGKLRSDIDNLGGRAGWSDRNKVMMQMHRLRAGGNHEVSQDSQPVPRLAAKSSRITLDKAISAFSLGNVVTAAAYLESLETQLRKAQQNQHLWSKYLTVITVIGLVAFVVLMSVKIRITSSNFLRNQQYLLKKEKSKWAPIRQDVFLINRRMNAAFHPKSDLDSEFKRLNHSDDISFHTIISNLVSEQCANQTEAYLSNLFFKSRTSKRNLTNPLLEVEVASKTGKKYYCIEFRRDWDKSILDPVQGNITDITKLVKQRKLAQSYKQSLSLHKDALAGLGQHGSTHIIAMFAVFQSEIKSICKFAKAAKSSKAYKPKLATIITSMLQTREAALKEFGMPTLARRVANANVYFSNAQGQESWRKNNRKLLSNLNKTLQIITSLKQSIETGLNKRPESLNKPKPKATPIIAARNDSAGLDLKTQIVRTVQNLKEGAEINLRFTGFNQYKATLAEAALMAEFVRLVLRDRLKTMKLKADGITEIRFQVYRENTGLHLNIADDYQGFSLNRLLPKCSKGIALMQSNQEFLEKVVFNPKFCYIGMPERKQNDLYIALKKLNNIGGEITPSLSNGRLSAFDICIPSHSSHDHKLAKVI